MPDKKVVIVGGVAGGASTAARLRRLDESAKIVMLERGEYISFANCGLPYYIGDVITEREKLLVQTEAGMEARFNMDIRVRSEAVSIDRNRKEVEVVDLVSGNRYREPYDVLVLAPGAAPKVPKIEGITLPGIHTLRNMADTDKIRGIVDRKKPKKAVVIGAGYVGIEMAENLHSRGIEVVLLEALNQVMQPLDPEMAMIVENELREKGIQVQTGVAASGFHKNEDVLRIDLSNGESIDAELIILAIGVTPETRLARESGLELGSLGGIRVDDFLRTSDPDIYAVGDAIEVKNIQTNEYILLPLAGPANRQGRIAADNICGRNVSYGGVQGTSIIKAGELTAAGTGLTEKELKKKGIPYLKSYTISNSHAGYYPGASSLHVKLLFAPENGKVLGAQIVGADGVDKRIDVLAASINRGLTVYELQELELAYAPPFSSAKDPVNMAGYTAANILDGLVSIIHWEDYEADKGAYLLLDVRDEIEFSVGSIPGAVNIPVDALRSRFAELPRGRKIAVFCKVGLRGYIAARILAQLGLDVVNISGGYIFYKNWHRDASRQIRLDEQMEKLELDKATAEEAQLKRVFVDACGLQCPGPIMKVNQQMGSMADGEVLEVHASDPAFKADIFAWCEKTGNTLLGVEKKDKTIVAFIRKGSRSQIEKAENQLVCKAGKQKTMVVFSGDLDKAIASFIIANGALAMGSKVTMFFTFWGLNMLRKNEPVPVAKGLIDRMFGMMMPRGSKRLKLSKMNMAGMGGMMIRKVMQDKNVYSLEELINQARQAGVRMIACQMSMDVMGIRQEELIDGIEIGGVAAFLGSAEESDTTLFI